MPPCAQPDVHGSAVASGWPLTGLAMISEREKDLAFLRQCILYDDSAERHKLEETITHGAAEWPVP